MMEQSKKPNATTNLILVLLIVNLLQLGLVGANQLKYADCMKNPFAAGCRGISAKRSQLPAAMQTLQQGDGRSAEQIPINNRYRGNYAARLSPPVAELIITNQWLIAECAYNRLPPTLDSFLSSDAYYQHQNEAGERVPEERQTVRLQN